MKTTIFVFARPPTGKQDAWMAYRYYLGGRVCHMETNLFLKREAADTSIHLDGENAYVLCQLHGPVEIPIELSVPGVTHVRIVEGTVDQVLASLRAGQISTVVEPIMLAA